MQKKVLFISQSAGRTGAPLMLLNLLKWLKGNSGLSFEVLLLDDGSLRKEFAALAPVHIFPVAARGDKGLISRTAQRLGLIEHEGKLLERLLAQLRESGIGLIYANTIVNGRVLETLEPLGCPTITHVHELNYWIERSGEKNLQQVRRHTNHYIAASGAVKENLISNCAIPAERIDVVHSFIPATGLRANSVGIRQQFSIPEDAFVILGSGHETWRKGKDLFVLLAAQVQKLLPERQTHFLWVGGWQNAEHERNILHDVNHLGIFNRVHFTREVQNPLDYFAAGDIFAMVSREDPFPLVCLEAAALSKPVLCFEGAGGMPEFVEENAGFIVPYLDIDAMIQKIMELAIDEKLRKRFGEKAAQKVQERHDISVAAPKILKVINHFL